jgi:PKD repeat protein
MSALNFEFDPTGTSAANKITGETQAIDLTKSVMVMPVNHPFFAESLSTVTVTDGSSIKVLTKGVGYLMGPLFLEAGARCTGKIVNTYIIIIDKELEWTGISMSYQTLGGYQDTLLLSELNGITFDTSKATQWLKIKGGAGFYDVYQRGGRLANRTMMDVFAEGLDNISNNLLAPPGSNKAWGQRISELEKLYHAIVPEENDQETEVFISTATSQTVSAIENTTYVIDRVSNLNIIPSGKVMSMITPSYANGVRSTTSLPTGYFEGTIISDSGYPWWKRAGDTSVLCRINGFWFLFAPGLQNCYVSTNECELPTLAEGWSAYDLGINTNRVGAVIRQSIINMFTHHDITVSVPYDIAGDFDVCDYMGSMKLGVNKVSAPHQVGLPAPLGILTLTESGTNTKFTITSGKIRRYTSGGTTTTTVVGETETDQPISYIKLTSTSIKFTNPGDKSGTWTFGDSTSTTEKNPTHVYGNEGSFTVTFTDAVGNQQTVGPIVIDVPLPAPAYTTTYTASAPNVITFKPVGADRYEWTINGVSYSITSPTVVFAAAGTYPVTLTGYNTVGESTNYTGSITVTMPNVAPIVSLSHTVSSLTASFTTTVSDETAVTYLYNFGDGTTSTESRPTHTYAANGTYTVSLVVTDTAGLTTQKSTTVTVVKDNVAPVVSLSHTKNNLVVNFTSTVIDEDSIAYNYNFGDGTGTSSLPNPSYTYANSGTYAVTLTVTDSRGASTVKTETVTVTKANVNPIISFEHAASDLQVTFISTVDDEDAVTYSYNFGDGTTSTQSDPVHAYAVEGTYTVTLTVTDSRGGVSTYSNNVTVVEANIAPVVTIAYSADELVATFTTTVVDKDPVTYSYTFGDGVGTSTQPNPVYTYTESGDYVTVVTVTDSRGASTSKSIVVNVAVDEEVPVEPSIDFTYDLSGLTASFGAIINYAVDSVTYVWNFGDGSGEAYVVDPTHVYGEEGEYVVTLTVTDSNGLVSTETKTITVVDGMIFTYDLTWRQ